MTYFNLRKRDADPEPEAVETDAGTTEDETPEEEIPAAPDVPHGPANALWAGISGPGRWLTARGRPGMAWLLYAGSAWAVGFYGGWIAAGLCAAWLLGVLLFIPREALDRIAAKIERTPGNTPAGSGKAGEQRPADTFVDPLPGLLWELIGDAPGVHLKTVVAHLHTTGLDTACDRAKVRAALARRGITVKGSVREADGRVNEGVHRADLQGWEEARSPAAPAMAPEARSSPVATALTSNVAKPATAVATPPARLRRLLSRGAR
ncbi:hypothetical protein ACFU96_21690 [Streptomyces sp. NPDC057620]|uniref:hypothetical protein n=1 Tax=Streptomyces sp. NPDC057620 TaxID=3346185 RepID=UPI0036AC33C4